MPIRIFWHGYMQLNRAPNLHHQVYHCQDLHQQFDTLRLISIRLIEHWTFCQRKNNMLRRRAMKMMTDQRKLSGESITKMKDLLHHQARKCRELTQEHVIQTHTQLETLCPSNHPGLIRQLRTRKTKSCRYLRLILSRTTTLPDGEEVAHVHEKHGHAL